MYCPQSSLFYLPSTCLSRSHRSTNRLATRSACFFKVLTLLSLLFLFPSLLLRFAHSLLLSLIHLPFAMSKKKSLKKYLQRAREMETGGYSWAEGLAETFFLVPAPAQLSAYANHGLKN